MTMRNDDLRMLGIESEDIAEGNVGFEIEDMEGYFLREAMENRREQGLEVPEEFQPTLKGRKELDLYRRMKDTERLELERQEDKKDQWAWTDQDERDWAEDCQARGFNVTEDMEGFTIKGQTLSAGNTVNSGLAPIVSIKEEIKKDNTVNSGLVPVVEPVIVKTKASKEAKGEANMANKNESKVSQAEVVEEIKDDQPKMNLLDLSFGRSVSLKGEFKMSKIEKNKKGLAMIRLEGKNKTVLISIGGETHTNLWAGVVETSQKTSGPTMVEL